MFDIFYFLLKAVKYPTNLYKPMNIQTNNLKLYIMLLFLILVSSKYSKDKICRC